MLFDKAVVFTDIHLGNKNNSRLHNQDCEDFIIWMIAEAKKHPKATLLWVQDEPANQGPWPYIALTASEAFVAHEELSGRTIRRVSRRATASPATGNHHLHEEEEKALMTEAFTR